MPVPCRRARRPGPWPDGPARSPGSAPSGSAAPTPTSSSRRRPAVEVERRPRRPAGSTSSRSRPAPPGRARRGWPSGHAAAPAARPEARPGRRWLHTPTAGGRTFAHRLAVPSLDARTRSPRCGTRRGRRDDGPTARGHRCAAAVAGSAAGRLPLHRARAPSTPAWAAGSTATHRVPRSPRRAAPAARRAPGSTGRSASSVDRAPARRPVLHDTTFTQPALFAVEYALAQLWRAGAWSRPPCSATASASTSPPASPGSSRWRTRSRCRGGPRAG